MSHHVTQSHIEPGKVKNLRVDVPEVLRSCTSSGGTPWSPALSLLLHLPLGMDGVRRNYGA